MFAGQTLGIREIDDLGYFDQDEGRIEPGLNPFAPEKVLTMYPQWTQWKLARTKGFEPLTFWFVVDE